ncbi:MAG TPA: hypothetical protein VID51_10820 [Solirubrobacterales bacterium]
MGPYLLGVAEIGLIVGFAWLGAATLRRRLLAGFEGVPAHLASAVLALALLLWAAELLGSFGLFEPVPYLAFVAVMGSGLRLRLRGGWGCPSGAAASSFSPRRRLRTAATSPGEKPSKTEGHPHPPSPATLVALAIAAVAVVKFGLEVKPHLSTGITGFDSTWYHGPFAAGFFQTGDTWSLHFIAPQFLAWFYPANSELLHGVGMVAFDRDLLSPLLNLGWFIGCLVASWCIGRPYRVAPFSLALGAIALSLPALSDQAGEARNDIVGIFFLLAAVAVALNAWAARGEGERLGLGAVAVIGLAAGLAAGTKLNFLLPAAVLVVGLAVIAPRGGRGRALAVSGLAALAGGGYWYLRNLVHTGNPLPWIKDVGPISLPGPEQALGGREGHSVLGYLGDASVWSDWLLPGLHDGLTIFWPVIGAAAFTGLVLCLGRRSDPALRVAALAGLAAALAWLIAPTSASGPDGIPRGFESGLRYLAPALVLGLALLPAAPAFRRAVHRARSPFQPHTGGNDDRYGRSTRTAAPRSPFAPHSGRKYDRYAVAGGFLALIAVAVGYPVQHHYLENRYENPAFTTPGLNAAFKWAQGIEDARIATTSTRQYPLYGRDLSNEVDYIGEEQPHGGFTAPTTCRQWRKLLNEGDYDYVVTSRDRIEPSKSPYPPTARWTRAPNATVVLRTPPTVIYKLRSPLDPSACR